MTASTVAPAGRRPWRAAIAHVLYDLAYVVALLITFPYLAVQLAISRRYRAGLMQRLSFLPQRARRPCIWVHGVSVGEVRTARPLVERLEVLYPDLEVIISSTTMAGHKVARGTFPEHYVFYFPLDFGPVVRRVMRKLRPSVIVLMELEIWPNLLYVARKRRAPVLVMNGRLSERSFRGYRRLQWFLPELDLVDFYAVQNETYAQRLRDLGVPTSRAQVTGNLKYEALPGDGELLQAGKLRATLAIRPTARVLLGGSTHPPEEEILLRVFFRLRWTFDDLRLILVPRHIERVPEIERAAHRLGLDSARVTDVRTGRREASERVYILDAVGELTSFYAATDVVFVGGSLVGHGGHNMREPASLGKPVLFGPHVQNFHEDVTLLLQSGAALQVKSEAELEREIARLLTDRVAADELGARAKCTVRAVRGACEKNLKVICEFLTSVTPRHDEGSRLALSEGRCG